MLISTSRDKYRSDPDPRSAGSSLVEPGVRAMNMRTLRNRYRSDPRGEGGLGERAGDGVAEGAQRLRRAAAQVDAQRAAAALAEDSEVAARLSRLHDAERRPLPRQRHVVRVVAGHLHDDA